MCVPNAVLSGSPRPHAKRDCAPTPLLNDRQAMDTANADPPAFRINTGCTHATNALAPTRPVAAAGQSRSCARTARSTVRNGERDRQRFDRTPSRRMLEEPTHRIRHSTHNDADRLLAVLPQHLSDTAPFSLTPGHRFANVKGQRWSATGLVRWQTWAHPDEVKARTGTSMLLNGNAAPVRNKQIDKL